jgi:DNA repair exonuclease SbcCD ATPase subunit
MECTIEDVYNFYQEYPEYIGQLKVQTRYGYFNILACDYTAHNSHVITVKTNSNKEISGSPDHLLWVNNKWTKIKDIKFGDILQTKEGNEIIESVTLQDYKLDLMDLQVDMVEEFYANDIVSHNSTVLDALIFGLFGVAFRNINIPDLINDTNEADMVVEVEFSVGRTNYMVRRGIKPKIFEIYINRSLVDQESKSRDYQKHLERNILKLNRKSFTQVVVLGSASFIPFMQLPLAERRYLIEDLLDIQIFSAMNVALKARVADMKDEYIALCNAIELQNEKILLVKSYLKKLNSDNVNAIAEKKQIIIQNQEQQNVDYDNIENIQQEIVELLKDTLNNKPKIQEKIRKLELSEDKLKTTKVRTEKESEFYKENNQCPVCKQSIDDTFKNKMLLEKTKLIIELESALGSLQKELEDSESQLNNIQKLIVEAEEKTQDIGKLQSSIRAIDSFIEKVQKEIEDLQEKSGDTQEQETKLKALQVELGTLTEQRDNLTSRKHCLDIIAIMLKDTGIKTKIIRQYLPIINKTVNKYLAAMDFFANFSLDESFKETIHIRGSKERNYYQLSEGQKLRIDLAILFTWRDIARIKNSANTNLLMMDEIFQMSLDQAGIEDLLKLIQTMSKDMNIFVISPQGDLLVDKFVNNIKFTEEHGFAVME